jgi:hypothetical protein
MAVKLAEDNATTGTPGLARAYGQPTCVNGFCDGQDRREAFRTKSERVREKLAK